MRLLRALPVPLVLIVMIGLAGEVLGRVYSGPLLTELVLGAAVASVAVSVAARRLPSWLVAPLSVVGLAGYVVLALWLAARRAELTDPFGTVVSDATRNGIPRLLTAMIPVEPVPDTVLIPVVAAWLAGLAAAEVVLRTNRVLLGYLPPALLLAGALYVVGPNADPALWPSVAFAAVGAIGLAWNSRPASPPASEPAGAGAALPVSARLRLLVGTALGLVVVIGLAVVVAPVVAEQVSGRPVDPRRYVQPPQVDSLDENPLIRISGWALNPKQKLFDVRTTGDDPLGEAAPGGGASPDGGANPSGGPDGGDGSDGGGEAPPDGGVPPVRIRLAVLNDYDGATWHVGAVYRNAGRILPAAPLNPDASARQIRQEITVEDLSGRLLPAVATPHEVSGARIAYDPGSGTLMRPEGLSPGLRYTVASVEELPDLNLLATANVPSGNAVARVLRVADGAPEQLQRLAEQLASDNGAPYSRAIAIEDFLSQHYRIVADAPSGHAYPNLGFFLFGPRNGGGQRGTSEQFAAAYAVLGRLMGLPTRVVVGFDTPAGGGGAVLAGNAYAWPEVLFDGVGWVPFDPLPRPNTQPRPVEEDFKPKPDDPPPSPDEQTPSATPAASASATAAAAPGGGGGIPGPILAGGGSGALLLILGGLVLAVTAARRAQRRRRIEVGPPGQRIAGAWREVTDALRLAGRPAAGHLDATEIAEHARDVANDQGAAAVRPPVPPIDDLASLVNLAAFAPLTASEEQARQAGTEAVAYATALRARRTWWRRVLWSVHPGPLRWRR